MSDIQEEQKRLYKRAEENDLKAKMKPLFPEDVEMICIIKDDYDELLKENKKLKELCDKYEEEHNTTFEYWKHLVKEDYKSRCDKAIEYIEYEMPCLWEVDEIFEDMDGKDYNTWKEYDENKLLNILKGDNK